MQTSTTTYRERFKDAPWFGKHLVTVGGGGGIGSWLCALLAKAGHEVSLYEFDTIESHNIGGQLFGTTSIGKKKSEMIQHMAKALGESPVHTLGKFDRGNHVDRITFSAFDNMDARKKMIETWYDKISNEERGKDIPAMFIDGRLEAETAIIYCVKSPKDWERYMSEMFDDSELERRNCTFASTSHNAAIIAGYMVGIMNNQITNKVEGMNVRTVPYKISYELPTMTQDVIL